MQPDLEAIRARFEERWKDGVFADDFADPEWVRSFKADVNTLLAEVEDSRSIVQAWRTGRGSGRTSRLLRDAIIRSMNEPQSRIIVVFPTEKLADTARYLTRKIAEEMCVGDAAARIEFYGIQHVTGPGWHPDGWVAWLVDHSVYDLAKNGRDSERILKLEDQMKPRHTGPALAAKIRKLNGGGKK